MSKRSERTERKGDPVVYGGVEEVRSGGWQSQWQKMIWVLMMDPDRLYQLEYALQWRPYTQKAERGGLNARYAPVR
jgi:hypothetical protein